MGTRVVQRTISLNRELVVIQGDVLVIRRVRRGAFVAGFCMGVEAAIRSRIADVFGEAAVAIYSWVGGPLWGGLRGIGIAGGGVTAAVVSASSSSRRKRICRGHAGRLGCLSGRATAISIRRTLSGHCVVGWEVESESQVG
jgi:hypothetical protein